ncbi:Sushi domain-containing protein 2 [Holothuria leucospilota]|uniref:Sushi domain-containing protein 2 n=1 Tax=Holothuria leucospilota TaxID=206669 RepID=A0A9Q1C2Z7_HOLLE|nr:Sushi domain-containing protein 2 [Holothuria leucospilota]
MAWVFIFLLLLTHEFLISYSEGNGTCKGITRGRHFVIAFTGNHAANPSVTEISLVVVAFSNIPTAVTLSSKYEINGVPYKKVFQIAARKSRLTRLPIELLLGTLSERDRKVIEVEANNDVSVYGLNYAPYTTDAFLVIPVNHLGLSYVVMSYENDGFNDDESLFAVVGVKDNTKVAVTLAASVTFEGVTYLSGETLIFSIGKYEVVQLVADLENEYIGGSIVVGDKPFALFSGHLCASTPGSHCDTLSEQIVPVRSWGTRHIYTATGSPFDTSVYIIHAYYENTVITTPEMTDFTLQPGDFWQGELNGSGIITTSQPASVLQLLRTINGQIVDPSIIQIPTEEQFGYIFGFSTPPKSGGDEFGFFNFLNVLVKQDEEETLLLNKEPVMNLSNMINHGKVPGTDYLLLTIEVQKGEGVYFVEQGTFNNSLSPFSVIVYGYEDDETYGYSAGLSLPSDQRLLAINPFFLREVGGEQMVITLPCLETDVLRTKVAFCRFQTNRDPIDIRAYIVNSYTIICTSPRFHHLGNITVEVSLDGKETFPFRGNVYILSQYVVPPTIRVETKGTIAAFVDFLSDDAVSLHWEPNELPDVRRVDISLVIEGIEPSSGIIWSNDILIAEEVENRLGFLTFRPTQLPKKTVDNLRRVPTSTVIFIVQSSPSDKPLFHVLSSGFLLFIKKPECSDWFEELNSKKIEFVPSCPCTEDQASVDGNFRRDGSSSLDYFHEGASSCYRSSFGVTTAGQQCCYSPDGNILMGPPGGGTADAFAPGNSLNAGTIKHLWYDVLPWVSCCKLSNECEIYYEHRPSDDCSDYEPPRPTGGTGDPHFISLDGKEFTFNGAGEFLLVRSSLHDMTFQARMEVLPGTDASVYTAFVLISNDSAPIQVQRSSFNDTQVLIDGVPIELYYDGFLIRQQDFQGLSLEVNEDLSKVWIRLHVGVALVISVTPEMMSFILQLPDEFKNNVKGLLGNFNDNIDDDFTLANRSVLSPNSSLEEIHYEFGLSWMLDVNSSLFTYLPPYDFFSFHNPGFTPTLEFPDANDVSEDVRILCGESVSCLFDAVTTGSLNFANDSLQENKVFEKIKEQSIKIVSCGFPGKVKNGYTNGSIYLQGSVLSVMCGKGFSLVGSTVLTCEETGTWSDRLPTCIPDQICAPPNISNAQLTESNYTLGSLLGVSCLDGFTLDGPSVLKCTETGEWIPNLPECKGDLVSTNLPDRICAPPNVSNAQIIDANYTVGSVLNVLCLDGFTIEGPSVLECTDTGEWIPELPECNKNHFLFTALIIATIAVAVSALCLFIIVVSAKFLIGPKRCGRRPTKTDMHQMAKQKAEQNYYGQDTAMYDDVTI